jgi:hypothetical protein
MKHRNDSFWATCILISLYMFGQQNWNPINLETESKLFVHPIKIALPCQPTLTLLMGPNPQDPSQRGRAYRANFHNRGTHSI